MDFNNRKKGDFGESVASRELVRKGYKILARNFRLRSGEIDIVAQKCNTIVFVEVKLRTNTQMGMPIESVNLKKQKKIIETAKKYIYVNNITGCDFRFDIIEILLTDSIMLRHTENAFWE